MKQLLPCGEQEGSPVVLSVSRHFLVAGTDTGHVKMWDLSRRYIRTLLVNRNNHFSLSLKRIFSIGLDRVANFRESPSYNRQ